MTVDVVVGMPMVPWAEEKAQLNAEATWAPFVEVAVPVVVSWERKGDVVTVVVVGGGVGLP